MAEGDAAGMSEMSDDAVEPRKRGRGRPTAKKSDNPEPMPSKSAGGVEAAAPPGGMLAVIERAIVNPDVNVANLRELFEFQKDLMKHQAEINFNEAKARILGDLANIKIYKTKSVLYDVAKNDPSKGKAEAFRYAPLEEIDQHVHPLLVREEIDASYTTEPRPDGGGAIVTLKLKHKEGHFETYSLPLPLDSTGGKTNIQAMGSTLSYGRRYTLCMAFNIVVLGDDDDGIGGFVDAAQIENIRGMLKQIHGRDKSKGDEKRFCDYLQIKSLEELPQRSYRKATSALEEALDKLGGAA